MLPPTPSHAGESFFNRVDEVRFLEVFLRREPVGVLLLVGPPNCGKSALIKHLVGRRQEHGMPSPLHLNLRHTYCPGPAAFNHALLRATKQAWCLDDAALWKLRLQGLDISILGSFGIPALSADMSLQNIMDALIKLVTEAKTARDAAGDARPLPLIVVDEANALADWQRSDEVTLRALLRFFVFLTKEARLAHVLLATSDAFLMQWLETLGLPPDARRVVTLGNFGELEAKAFVTQHAVRVYPEAPPCDAGDWPRVHKVCGGNANALLACTMYAGAHKSWAIACDELCDNAAVHFNSGLNPASSATAAWSGDQYRAVVRLIAESPHGAVSCAHAEEQPECGGGAVLASLQKHNFLLRRSFHALARDVDEAVFGATSAERGDVYMLPSAAALCIARARVDAKSP